MARGEQWARNSCSFRWTPKIPAQLEAADEDLLRVVAAVLEGAQDRVGRVVVERLKLVPVGPPEQGTQVRLVEDAPGEVERVGTIAVDEVAGDGARHFVPLGVILDGGPAPAVGRKVAGGVGEVDDQPAAVAAMDQVPLLVEPAPVVTGCTVRMELAQVAAAGREQTRRVGVFPLRKRPSYAIFQPPAAPARGRPDCAGHVIDGQDFRAGVVDAVGDEYLVARVIVLGNRPPTRDAVLLVAEEILDAEQEAVL